MNETKFPELARRQTDPLWIQEHFLATGHHANTPNASATFVSRRERRYMVTCGHVLRVVEERRSEGEDNLTMALDVGRIVLNMSSIGPHGVQLSVRTPKVDWPSGGVDVALAPLHPGDWEILERTKNKTTVDLDAWREPSWSAVRHCVAVGYENEGKETTRSEGVEKVATRMLEAVAELGSIPDPDAREFTLVSRLDQPHGYRFSGMSGGAVYAIERDGEEVELVPIGIVCEGYPSTSRLNDEQGGESKGSFLCERDIFIRALKLTPDIFDGWVERCGFFP